MDNSYHKNTAIYLFLGILLMVATMVLHPTGGNFETLVINSTIAIVSHSLAIFSVPFSMLGFIGLTNILGKESFFSKLALVIMLTGLIAAMLAATLNGLALPLFVSDYASASAETISSIRPVLRYNMILNHSFDYILISAMFISTLLWCIDIQKTKVFPKWIGYFGILLVSSALIAIIFGFYFLDLHGFRIFILGWVIWIFSIAVFVYRKANTSPETS